MAHGWSLSKTVNIMVVLQLGEIYILSGNLNALIINTTWVYFQQRFCYNRKVVVRGYPDPGPIKGAGALWPVIEFSLRN
jgi:hypothetical protein